MAGKKKNPRTIRVFIASPGGLEVERAAFKEVIDELNSGFGDGAGVKFEPLGWEDTVSSVGRRPQSVINQDVDKCEVFILAMHRRWGQDAPDSPYSSYTEEEFHLAFKRWQKTEVPEIFVFFKDIDSASMADPGEQLKKVLEFRRYLEGTRQVLYRGFADENGFKREVDRHLRAYAKGDLPKLDAPRDKVLLPLDTLAEVEKERKEKEEALAKAEVEHKVAEAAVARAEELALSLAENAAKAALDGRIEEARQDFAKATNGTTNLHVLYLAYAFYRPTGDLASAEEMLERCLAISGRDTKTTDTAAALGNLGIIYAIRGELDRAEEMHKKALAINENLGRETGMASNYGNLASIYWTRNKLDLAEKMLKKSMAIHEKLDYQKGMASDYGNLGLIYRDQGKLEQAEKMHNKSLAINEKLGRQEGIAIQYGNLGELWQKRPEDLGNARSMHLKALQISEKLGHKGVMAEQHRNLGIIAKTEGSFESARTHLKQAYDLYENTGMKHMVEQVKSLLDGLPEN